MREQEQRRDSVIKTIIQFNRLSFGIMKSNAPSHPTPQSYNLSERVASGTQPGVLRSLTGCDRQHVGVILAHGLNFSLSLNNLFCFLDVPVHWGDIITGEHASLPMACPLPPVGI